MQVFHARKHVFRVELFFEVIIGLQREPAFVTDLFERGGDGREINGHGERDLVGIVPTVVIVNVKRLQAVAQLDMKIEKGHLYGLIGPNGAGKICSMKLSEVAHAAKQDSSFASSQFHMFSVAIFTPQSFANGNSSRYISAFSAADLSLSG